MPSDKPKKTTTAKKPTPARKPAAAKPRKTTTRARKTAVTHDHIATRAYFLHLEQGGDEFENWIRAERELAGVR